MMLKSLLPFFIVIGFLRPQLTMAKDPLILEEGTRDFRHFSLAEFDEWFATSQANNQKDLSHSLFPDKALNGKDLRSLNLSNCDLRNQPLENITEASLRHTNLSGSKLQKNSLNGKILCCCNLSNCNLRNQPLRNIGSNSLRLTNLSGSRLQDGSLNGKLLLRTNLSHCDLRNQPLLRLFGGKISHVNFSGSQFAPRSLLHKKITHSSFIGCDLTHQQPLPFSPLFFHYNTCLLTEFHGFTRPFSTLLFESNAEALRVTLLNSPTTPPLFNQEMTMEEFHVANQLFQSFKKEKRAKRKKNFSSILRLNRLPNEILLQIFSSLPLTDLLSLALADRRFFQLLQDKHLLTKLTLLFTPRDYSNCQQQRELVPEISNKDIMALISTLTKNKKLLKKHPSFLELLR